MVLTRSCWLQVNSEFQAFKHIDVRSRGEMARAVKSLEATLALQPTLILTNSLPCSLDVIVWQVGSTNHHARLIWGTSTKTGNAATLLMTGESSLLHVPAAGWEGPHIAGR